MTDEQTGAPRQTRDSIGDVWGPRAPYEGAWPVRVDERTLQTPDHWVQSACVLCSTGCGMDIGVKDGRIVGVRGRADDRVNHGRLGPKGLNGWEANASADRLTKPLVRQGRGFREATWDEAMSLIVERAKDIRGEFGGGAFGFYNSGQLFIEDYYTLALVATAGIGTLHLDANTRLCTATAATAFIESFGTDGPPGSYEDFDVADAMMLVGHNMAATQTVLWTRVLDRLAGPRPPRIVVIDPRRTPTADRAEVHLTPRIGTNVPVLSGLMHLLLKHGWIDRTYIDEHTVGFEQLECTVAHWPASRVAEVAGVPARQLEAAAEIIGTSPALVSTTLQGVFQSPQATAAAVQVNNIHLLRGMIGRPGCSVFQMNGQPTSQNTRECGCNGELIAFRNWENQDHIRDQARIWNVEPDAIPHWSPPTHAMQIFRYAETGSIRFLWVIGTNPAVSMPELHRIREVLSRDGLFLIVQDAFMTETAQYADVVLPAAIWGEKTGCFTNADRTVHCSHKAVEPPGEARADMDIFIDFSRRMGFVDKDGAPLVKWSDPEACFEAWKECSRGRPCDYSGLSYAKLTGGSGVQWPCNADFPDGADRLYKDGVFNTSAAYCETYGHDIITGASITEEKYRAHDPAGRAMIKPAEYVEPEEQPDGRYPFWLTTGRVVYHFHTRTKTGLAPRLQDAAPDAFVEISNDDARELGIADGEMVEVQSRRGAIRVKAAVTGIEPGHLFIPFHYGYWDDPGRCRAANELTLTGWDPVSKQPYVKYAAARVKKVR